MLHAIDAQAFDQSISEWLQSQKPLREKAIAVDGKTLRGSRDGEQAGVHLLSVVTADALLTQREFAKHLVEQKGAHYLFTVKGNQPNLLEDLKQIEFEKNCNYRSFTSAEAASFGRGLRSAAMPSVLGLRLRGFSITVSPLWGRPPQTACFAGGC